MEAVQITGVEFALTFLLLIIPVAIFLYLNMKEAVKRTLIAVGRMTIQLILIGLFLEYLFKLNSPLVNVIWVIIMLVFATHSAVINSNLKFRIFALPVLGAFILANLTILWYFLDVIMGVENLLNARYVIAVGGMLLGNSLKGIIIGINHFFMTLKRGESKYFFRLAAGASRQEALFPFLRESLFEALKPSLASMATMGIVFLPGMMTGQILSGTDPFLAIKYQIAIVIAIFVAVSFSIMLSILFALRVGFNGMGILKGNIFRGVSG